MFLLLCFLFEFGRVLMCLHYEKMCIRYAIPLHCITSLHSSIIHLRTLFAFDQK